MYRLPATKERQRIKNSERVHELTHKNKIYQCFSTETTVCSARQRKRGKERKYTKAYGFSFQFATVFFSRWNECLKYFWFGLLHFNVQRRRDDGIVKKCDGSGDNSKPQKSYKSYRLEYWALVAVVKNDIRKSFAENATNMFLIRVGRSMDFWFCKRTVRSTSENVVVV